MFIYIWISLAEYFVLTFAFKWFSGGEEDMVYGFFIPADPGHGEE